MGGVAGSRPPWDSGGLQIDLFISRELTNNSLLTWVEWLKDRVKPLGVKTKTYRAYVIWVNTHECSLFKCFHDGSNVTCNTTLTFNSLEVN